MTQQDPPSARPDTTAARADETRAENAEHASVRTTGSTDALPVAPALGASLDAAAMPRESTLVSKRVVLISAMAIVLFIGTVSFLFTTPGLAVGHLAGVPILGAQPGQFLLKDVVLLGVSVWTLGESLGARGKRRAKMFVAGVS